MMYLPRDLTRIILEMVQGKTWRDCIIESFTEVVEIERRGVVRCPRNVTTIDLHNPLGGRLIDGWNGHATLNIRSYPQMAGYEFDLEIKWLSSEDAVLGVQMSLFHYESYVVTTIPEKMLNLDLRDTMPRALRNAPPKVMASILTSRLDNTPVHERWQMDAECMLNHLYQTN